MDLSAELLKNPHYIKRVNESVEMLYSHFDELKKLLHKPLSDDNYDAAFKHFYEIFDVVPLMKLELNMPQIVRGRMHKNGDQLCNEHWQVSYNWRFQHKIELGRFNQRGEPLFYASLPTQSDEIDYIFTCSLECCKELSLEYNTPDVQDITLSGWAIEKPFYVINLAFDDLHLKYNPDLKESVSNYFKAIHANFSEPAAAFIESFLRYFSEVSRTRSNKNESYQLLGPLFIAIKYYSEHINKEPIYGLIYPSAMSMAKGLNVVLTRDAVKQFLRLDKVVMYRYFLVKPEGTTYVVDKCSDIVKVQGRKFKITNYIPAKA